MRGGSHDWPRRDVEPRAWHYVSPLCRYCANRTEAFSRLLAYTRTNFDQLGRPALVASAAKEWPDYPEDVVALVRYLEAPPIERRSFEVLNPIVPVASLGLLRPWLIRNLGAADEIREPVRLFEASISVDAADPNARCTEFSRIFRVKWIHSGYAGWPLTVTVASEQSGVLESVQVDPAQGHATIGRQALTQNQHWRAEGVVLAHLMGLDDASVRCSAPIVPCLTCQVMITGRRLNLRLLSASSEVPRYADIRLAHRLGSAKKTYQVAVDQEVELKLPWGCSWSDVEVDYCGPYDRDLVRVSIIKT